MGGAGGAEAEVDVGFSCQVRAAQKQLRLTVSVDPAVPEELHGDPNRIQQCLLNLGNRMLNPKPQTPNPEGERTRGRY